MQNIARALSVIPLLALAGCGGTMQNARVVETPIISAPVQQPVTQTLPTTSPAQATANAAATSTFGLLESMEPSVVASLSEADKASATNAAFFALQFGRPGAPRAWQGSSGTTGQVTVGPYVRVNNLDCREFTHSVTVNGQVQARKGMACREQTGNWTVVESSSVA
jgi:surface antigen